MVAERRFGPVIGALFAILGVLLVRLFQVQVLEHQTWAAEAGSLARPAEVLANKRGRILDRAGRVLVEDEDIWRVDFVYRDFRRGHPLGIVTQARSLLEMRAVPVAETLAHLQAWAIELVRLTPAEIKAFGDGKELRTASLAIPAASDPKLELRSSRSKELAFYQEALLETSKTERGWIHDHASDEHLPASAAVAASRRCAEKTVLDDLAADLAPERDRLAELARLLPPRASETKKVGQTVDELLARIESARARYEDSAADALFEKATKFPPGRISTSTLVRGFDLAWIARSLRWDAARLRAWEESRRTEFEKDLDDDELPHILVRAGLADDEHIVESLLDGLATLYLPEKKPVSWRDLDELEVQKDFGELFRLKHAPKWSGTERAPLPLLDPDLRKTADTIEDPWLLLGTLAEMAGARTAEGVASSHDWAAHFAAIAAKDDHLEGAEAHAALRAILDALEARFTAACDAAVEAALAEGSKEFGRAGPLPLARDRLDEVEQVERFLLKDISSRPVRMAVDADYGLVHVLERDADLYRGFEVGPATRRRILMRDADGIPLAQALIGSVRGLSLREILSRQRQQANDLDGSDEEAAELASRLYRSDEKNGVAGVEKMFDAELRGKQGWLEATSLQAGRSDGYLRQPMQGDDVTLTLDADIQRAAEETLEHPELPHGVATDNLWFANPVGAIVLLTPDGEVLASASCPKEGGHPATPGRDLERTFARERTLTRPVFNPPGSSIKPFIAAYALDRLALDPNERFSCTDIGDGVGYKDRFGSMHCHAPGHGTCELSKALAVSCNATFAQIGERFTPEQLLEMAEIFGFGRPTGIRNTRAGGGERSGLREEATWKRAALLPKDLADPHARMLFANGLGLIEATPMQSARAMAGLVTGKLPEVRIVKAIANVPVEKSAVDLRISKAARETVLRDLDGVIRSDAGTARGAGLDRGALGFTFTCKTGTADTWDIDEAHGGSKERLHGQQKKRKQTWIVGWFPPEEPKAILVVMLHDVVEASTTTSAYVAAQFLRSPAVQRFARGDDAAKAAEASAPKSANPPANPAATPVEGRR